MVYEFQGDFLLCDAIAHHARFSPNRAAVICDGESLTWLELEQRTRQLAHALLARGLKKGDKVCLYMPSSLQAFVLLWGIIRSGGVVVALNQMVSEETLVRLINQSDGSLVFTDAALLPMIDRLCASLTRIDAGSIFATGLSSNDARSLEALLGDVKDAALDVRIEPSDSISIVYSSGSTGVPKGIEHSHFARHHYTFGNGHFTGFSSDSVAILATQLYANGTWMMMGPCMYRGGCCVIMPKFDGRRFLELVERHGGTHTFVVPTQALAILAAVDETIDVSSLKVVISAGQKLAETRYHELTKHFPATEIWENYGMSEGFGTLIGPEDYKRGKLGSVGKPAILDDLRIIDADGNEVSCGEIGEICGYSVGLMKGYYNDEARSREVLWIGPRQRTYIRSGDLGRIDEDGYLYVCGRAKDMIKSGGINVFPVDIEDVFLRHPDVEEAVAIGVPHPKWIETPLLFVRLKGGASIDSATLMQWGNERLGKFQRVSGVEIVEDLPRVTYGKVDKKALRKPYWED